ncbi:porin family protein [Fibrivirga algicola]|uniref:PorT family protein n=1 Tax=Fibrivirga algicola TaxID=2950420 RepID=A0ABX0QJE9_9BACT|nr:porin family protein [Fibrivirga algicola]ARK10448.1 hypothetical protein A6C57_08970 [Fibrella sp. ES10-3-2-2]NID11948.1 PorT family protein [Fibrivirga algicola]
MKIVYFVSAVLISVSSTCLGQVLYGVQGSIQSSNLSLNVNTAATGGIDPGSVFKSSIGYRAGLMADVPVTDQLSIRPQLLYSTKGYKLDFNSLFSSLGGLGGLLGSIPEIKVATNFIELPIQAMYGLDAGAGRVVLGAGPYVGYALSAAVDGKSTPFEAGSKRFDYGAALSVGYEMPSGLSVSAYYSHGFADMASSANTTQSPDPTDPDFNPSSLSAAGTAKIRSFGLTLGYFFGTGN